MKIQAQTAVRQPAGFAYAMQKDVYADFLFSNDVARTNKGNSRQQSRRLVYFVLLETAFGSQQKQHVAAKVGYLPDGTPMNRAGNAMNHPENLQPDPHTDGTSAGFDGQERTCVLIIWT